MRLTVNQEEVGSIPIVPAKYVLVAQMNRATAYEAEDMGLIPIEDSTPLKH